MPFAQAMYLEHLTNEQKDIVLQAMLYCDSIFESYSLDSVFGVSHDQLQLIISQWPDSDNCKGIASAIDGSLSFCTLARPPENWEEWFSFPRNDVLAVCSYWISLRPTFVENYERRIKDEFRELDALLDQVNQESRKWWRKGTSSRHAVREQLERCLKSLED